MTFVKIQLGNTVFDKELEMAGIVVNIDYENNTAILEVDKTGNITTEITSKLSNLVVVEDLKKKEEVDLNLWHSWVRTFHQTFSQPSPDKPTMLTLERIKARNSWMIEECEEMEEAETLEDQVDAAIDKLYFALGDLVELGVKPHDLLKIVQNANMGKLHLVDGKMIPVYKEDGKIKKPDDWEEKYAPEPFLAAEIERQLK